MRLSILHVSQPVDGGVARCVADLLADQLGRGWRVGVACPADGPLVEAVSSSQDGEHHAWPARRNPGPRSAGETVRLARIVRGCSPDLVHLHSSKAGFAGRLAIRGGRPTVFQPHAWSFLAVPGPVRSAAILWERRAAAWADAIVCVSEGERLAGQEAGVRAALRLVPNGVDLDTFRPATRDERTRARALLGLGPAPLAVCVGRLSRQKGQDLLVEAWPLVAARVPGAELVLVGSGPDEPALRGRARIAVDSDVRSWLTAANVVVQPSRWEGLAYTVLEAMASARAVVATDAAGMREALGDDSALVPVGDIRRLAEAIAGRLLNPERADADGQALRARAERLYDVRRATQTMVELYADVLERRKNQ